ncbi:MAG: hypothetical protein ACRC18_06895 [Cetobacterium sp.]
MKNILLVIDEGGEVLGAARDGFGIRKIVEKSYIDCEYKINKNEVEVVVNCFRKDYLLIKNMEIY